MINHTPKRPLSVLALLYISSFVWLTQPAGLAAQAYSNEVPDIQCAYVEAELTSIFMNRHPSLNVDEEVVELLFTNCATPTPKSRLIYSYIRSANSFLEYDGTNSGQLEESMVYYRKISRDRIYLDRIAATDLAFVQLYESHFARLAEDLEPRYVESIAANPSPSVAYGTSRGMDNPSYTYRSQVAQNYPPVGNYRGQSDEEPLRVYSQNGSALNQTGRFRSAEAPQTPQTRAESYTNFLLSASEDADNLYDFYSGTKY